MRAVTCGLLLLFATAHLARAQDEEGWRLGGNRQRYDMALEAPPPQVTGDVTIPTSFTVGEATFRGGRVPTFPIASPGDLVWFYVLGLPEGELADKRELPLEGRHTVTGGSLRTSGKQSLKRRGKKLVVTTHLELTLDVKGHPLEGQKAALDMRSTFDLKLGVLKGSSFELVANVVVAGQPGRLRWSGDVKPGERFDVGSAGFPVRVEKAIELGRQWLLRTTRARLASYRGKDAGQRLGRMALACFALLRSGLVARDLRQEFEWMASQPLSETYSVSLWIMALEALSIERQRLQPRAGLRSVARYQRGGVPAQSKELIAKAVAWLDGARKQGRWTYGAFNEKEKRGGDRSNSQFAALALHSAVACGVEVPKQLWEDVLAEILKAQEPGGPAGSLAGSVFASGSPFAQAEEDAPLGAESPGGTRVRPKEGSEARSDEQRGWAYGVGGKGSAGTGYGSMTAAGVSSLAIAREALGASEGGATQSSALRGSLDALRDGLAWLAENFDASDNPKRTGQHYYYWLYSLEKAMDTTGVERLAQREWWREAATELLTRQGAAGDWGGSFEDTALALLVLNRATLPAKLEIEEVRRRATGEGSAAEWDKVVVEGTGRLGVRQLLESMAETPQVAAKRLKLAQQAFAQLGEEHRPRLITRLAALLESSHKATRRWAAKTCKELAGSEEPAQLEVFSMAFEGLRKAGERRDPADIPRVRQALTQGSQAPALRHQALVVLCRLRAVEALPEVIACLEDRELEARAFAWDCLVTLAGGEFQPFDPKGPARQRAAQIVAWQGWLEEEGPALVQRESLQRAMIGLAHAERADAAAAVFREAGEAGWPLLVDALQDAASRDRAHALLSSLTGGSLPADDPDAWRRWFKDGRPKLAAQPETPADPERKPMDLFADDDGDADDPFAAAEDEEGDDRPAPAAEVPAKKPTPAAATRPLRSDWGLVPRPSQTD